MSEPSGPPGPLDPLQATPGTFGLRVDLGPLPPGFARLCAPPVLLPIPFDLVAEPPGPGHPVIVGAPGPVAAWRYDCWLVSVRTQGEKLQVGVSSESEMALAWTDLPGDRPPRYWWVPAEHVWVERPADSDVVPRRPIGDERPSQPPIRALTRVTDADRVIGRYGWLAGPLGWLLVVAVSDPYVAEVPEETRQRLDLPADLRDTWVHVLGRREWWQWGAAGILEPDTVAAVPAEAVWLE
jgi:hypothetical protein